MSRNAPSLLAFQFICIGYNPSKSSIEEVNFKIFLRHISLENLKTAEKIVLYYEYNN